MSESKSDSDDSSSSSSSDGSIPSHHEQADGDNDDEEEEQQQQEGYMFNNKLYPTYQQMVAAKQERNRQVLERTTSEISLMLGSEYGSSNKASGNKKKKPSKKLNKQSDGPPRRNPKRKARSPSSSSISTTSHLEDTPRKRSRSIGSRNNLNSSGGGSISSSVKVPSDVFMDNDNESMATHSTMYKNEKMLLQPYNRLVKDICIQTEHILVNGKRIQERERIYQEFRRRNDWDRLNVPQTNQAREEEEDDDMSTHEDITSTVDWKLFHSSITIGSLAQGNGDNIGKKNRQDRTDVEIVVPNFSSFMDDEDDIVIPEEYLSEETFARPIQQQVHDALPINNPAKYNYNNIIQERNKYYTSKGIDRYWDEEFGDGIDHDLFVKERCKYNDPTTDDDGLDNEDNTGNIMDTQDEDLVEAKKRYTASLLQRCWDRAVHAASSTLTVPLSDETEAGGLEGAVKTEEDDDISPPNQKVINTALHQKARDAVDDILDTLLAKDSSLRLMLDDPKKLKQQIDWRDIMDCLREATEERGKTTGEGVLNQSMMKSLSIRLMNGME